jgi:hypothetical protein
VMVASSSALPRRNLIPYVLLLTLTVLAGLAIALAVTDAPVTYPPTTGYVATHCTELQRDTGCLWVRVSSREADCVTTGLRRIVATSKTLAVSVSEAKALIARCESSTGH